MIVNNFRDIDGEKLMQLADAYCDDCILADKEVATGKGVQKIKERHIPTIEYFLYHWLRRNHFDFYKRGNWYKAKKNDNHPLVDTIKNIDELFKSLATDIVANEGKGIFYAKNRLGMSDKQENQNNNTYRIIDDTGTIDKINSTTSGATENP
jgi:hypothetical protein